MTKGKIEALVARLRAVSETGCDPDLPHEAADAIEALAYQATAAEQLLDVATGRVSHLYAGLCPDSASGTRPRDPECPACRAIETATLRKQGFNV